MTGFARVRRSVEQGELTLSLKSVNHRGLDLHFHLPPEFDALENEVRALLKSSLARGHVQIHLSYARTGTQMEAPLNRALLDTYMRAFRAATEMYQLSGEPDLNDVLRIPGMLSGGNDSQDVPEEVAKAVLELTAESACHAQRFSRA